MIAAFVVAILALVAFILRQSRAKHPMMPLNLFHSRTFRAVVIIGFAFVFCYFGLTFFMSLYLQQIRGLSAVVTGAVFLPMMIVGAALNLFSARFVERFGRRQVITAGLLLMVAVFGALLADPATFVTGVRVCALAAAAVAIAAALCARLLATAR